MFIDDDDDMAPSEAIYCLSSMHKTQECVCVCVFLFFFLGGGIEFITISKAISTYKYLPGTNDFPPFEILDTYITC